MIDTSKEPTAARRRRAAGTRAAWMAAALLIPGLAAAGGPDGETEGAAFLVNTYTQGAQSAPVVASERSGRFVVAFTDAYTRDGSSFGVTARLFDAGGSSLGSEFQVPTYTFASQSSPTAAWLGAEQFVIAWSSAEVDGASSDVFARRFDRDGGRLGEVFQVNTYTVGAQGMGGLDVAAAANGDFLVVWASHGQDGDNNGVFAQRFAGDGRRLGSELQVNTFTEVHQETPAVAPAGDGGFVVVWKGLEPGDSYNDVVARRFSSDGTALGGEFVVNSFTTGDQGYYVDVAPLPGGGFVVAWSSYDRDAEQGGAFAQLFDEQGERSGAEFQVNGAPQPFGIYGLSIASGGGQLMVVYEGNDESYDEILLGRRFSTDGAALGEEFAVDAVNERVGDPSVSASADGRFVVVWGVENRAGDPSDVVGRRYRSLLPPCVGDCDGDRRVAPGELVSGVRIALGALDVDRCPAFDGDANRRVDVVELVAAVDGSLTDCGE